MKSVDQLLADRELSIAELAERAQLEVERIEAIVHGRWTPRPVERERIAAALSTEVDQIIWGHTMDPRNVRYRRFGLKESF
ncbi:MAG: helix-turn-helix domain-containing protein [Planctomycetaceae bacterium]